LTFGAADGNLFPSIADYFRLTGFVKSRSLTSSPDNARVQMNQITEKPNDKFLAASGVWSRYDVTSMTLHRWLADAELDFPRPFYLGRFRFWRISELEAWEAKQPRAAKQAAA
jgi:predicted DNA-binding transcriptional regulator AlpA